MHCQKCGIQIEVDGNFCGTCGEEINKQSVMQSNSTHISQTQPTTPTASSNVVCILLIVVCAILWSVAPFISINAATLSSHGGQPTALQIAINDVVVIGDLTGTPVFWAALVSIVCIVICFFCALNKKRTAILVIATLTNVFLVIAYLDQRSFFANAFGQAFSTIGEVVGIGYIGIFILLLVAGLTCRKA